MNYRNIATGGLIVALLLFGVGGATAAFGISFDDVQSVSFGEVRYEQSDLVVLSTTTVGPGTNVDEIELNVDHSGSGNINATVDVWLLASDTEITNGTLVESFTPGESMITVTLEDRVRESAYNTVDIRITEN
ncbi:MAG: hypothetical protein J07HQX50_02113 [Haloquadratum sp. J07HQX50]|nr:MAG: hypothetical protein J07HQX50_02113 [Haloquadratum sp. J07HQX50]